MSLIPLGILAGIGGAISWVTRTYHSSGNNEYAYGLFSKADKSAIGLGSSNDDSFVVTKFNANGTVASQVKNNNAFPNGFSSTSASGGLDSSENIYGAGWTYQNGGFSFPALMKWNSSLGLTYGYWWSPGYNNSNFYDSSVNASGNLAITYRSNNSHPVVFYATSAGDIQYGIRLESVTSWPLGVRLSAANNAYVAYSNGSNNKIVKLNSSGTVQWFKTSTQFNSNANLNGLDLDNSENVYVGVLDASGYSRISKWSSAGVKQWETRFTAQTYYQKVAVDKATGDCYVLMQLQSPANWVILKLDSSGVLQWSRTISSTNSAVGPYATISFSDNSLLLGLPERTSTPLYQVYWWKIPADGSKTGTYTVGGVAHTYAAGSYTMATVTETWSNATNTSSAWGVMGTKASAGMTQGALTSNSSTVQL